MSVEKNVSADVVKVDVVGTHQSHCCLKHGCKYGSESCPVESGAVVQEFPCEYCKDVDVLRGRIAYLQEELEWSLSLEARGMSFNGF